jgi:pimeloyl-ACP methyl ester carboxylesterase
MTQIYILSGLGADERVFQKLDLSDLPVTFVQWIPPVQSETITSYVLRLVGQIKAPNPILIGLSFGGMMATEIAKIIPTERIILLASAKNKHELPFYFRLAGTLHLDKLIPISLLLRPTRLTYWLFGVQSEPDRQLLRNILAQTDPAFLVWAIGQIARWRNTTIPPNLKHIHGTTDRILPRRFVAADLTIKGGGHLIPLTHSEEVERGVRELLKVL